MAKTYNAAEVAVRDQIRGEIGDTGAQEDMILQDETIDSLVGRFVLSEAKAQCADRLATYYAMAPNGWGEADRREQFQDRAQFYRELAQRLRSVGEVDSDGNQGGSVAVGLLTSPDVSAWTDN